MAQDVMIWPLIDVHSACIPISKLKITCDSHSRSRHRRVLEMGARGAQFVPFSLDCHIMQGLLELIAVRAIRGFSEVLNHACSCPRFPTLLVQLAILAFHV